MAEAAQAQDAPPTHIELADWRIPMGRPRPSAVWPIVVLGQDPQTALEGHCAALGYLWENAGIPRYPLKASYRLMGRKWADYGAAVFDGLMERGIPPGEITNAGIVAMQHLLAFMAGEPTAAEVKAAEGN